MNVFLFFQASLKLSASRMEVLQRLKPSIKALLKLIEVNYPFLSPFEAFQITTVINITPKNKLNKNKDVPINKKFSLSEGFGFLTYLFNKSPKYVRTRTKRIPKPLLISLSSSYCRFFITNMITHGGKR